MALSPGKAFESDFQRSVEPDKAYIYRFRDSAASWNSGDSSRFTPSNICDYLIFNDETKTLYFCELKSTKNTSIPLSMIRPNQIKQLTEASKHNLIAGFVVNYREKDNYTAFINITDFNRMLEYLGKVHRKSFNIDILKRFNSVEIKNEKKRTRYSYDLNKFMNEVHK